MFRGRQPMYLFANQVPLLASAMGPGRSSTTEIAALQRLADSVGRYYSEELQTIYAIAATKDGLVLRHFVNGDVLLDPAGPDEFTTDRWWVSDLRFDRDAEGRVVGLRLSADGGRVRDLRMTKLEAGSPGRGRHSAERRPN
jgi:hypothetical protein